MTVLYFLIAVAILALIFQYAGLDRRLLAILVLIALLYYFFGFRGK